MRATRILVDTCKGAFVLTSDAQRETWSVAGPHFGGWEIFHAKGCHSGPAGLASRFKDQMTAVPHGHARHTAHAEHRAAKDLLKAAQTDPFKLSVKTIPLQDRTHQTNARPRLRIHVQTKQSRLQNQLPTHLAQANPCDRTTQIPAIVPTAQ